MATSSRTPRNAAPGSNAQSNQHAAINPPSPVAGTGGRPSHLKEHRRRNRHRAPLIALGVLVVLIAAVYAAGVAAFANICYPNTTIADVDVSLMRRDTAVSRVDAAAKGYRLSVAGDGFEWSYKPASTDEIIDAAAAVDNVIAANEPLAWPVRLVQAVTNQQASASAAADGDANSNVVVAGSAQGESDGAAFDVTALGLPETFDTQAFTDSLGQAIDAFNTGRTGTFDAAGAYDEEAGAFTLDKAHSNRLLDREAIIEAALTAVSTLESTVELTDESFTPLVANATDDELQAACDAANALIGTNVNLKMGGVVVGTLDGKQLAQWITFDENLSPQLSTEPVTAWVHELAQTKLDTVGSDRTYTRPDGKTITVGGGSYGWNSNEQELVKMLQDAVANKQVGDIDIPTLQTAAKYTAYGEPDWGAYADVDLSEQHARYYDASGNLLWESGCITGNPNKGNGTPTGIYMLNSNNGASVLVGKKDPKTGEPEYESPVSWWMPFIGNSIGFHDASWQASSSFSNPNAYKSVGSHGCINLPSDKAQELSSIIKVGDCVIVHY